MAVSFDQEDWNEIWSAGPAGQLKADISFDRLFPPQGPARYSYFLRLRWEDPASRPQELRVETDLQMAPLSLPEIQLGSNVFQYVDSNVGERRVRLTHWWRESSEARPPFAPKQAIFPADRAQTTGTRFSFSWAPAVDPNGLQIVDYHLQLSAREDLRHPLSATFNRLISKTSNAGSNSFSIPYAGLLNPDQTYYWRVRARNQADVWSPWSASWSFTPRGAGIPLAPEISVDRKSKTAVLRWKPNPEGSPPATFKIHGSDERGFTASHDPYPARVDRSSPPQTFPANLIGRTSKTEFTLVGPELPAEQAVPAFYRVVAVDESGLESGPSELVSMPRPLIVSRPPESVQAGERFSYQIESVRSKGAVRSVQTADDPYQMRFRGADEFEFSVLEGPDWLEINSESGYVTARPTTPGRFRITLKARLKSGEEDLQSFTLHVAPPDR